ncbi:hypothetical protein Godav_006702, partial [Gossypium davidsonii]|nr:hypothetical protein [Gossypium davidsonii]MBA0656501.1 hypothetical protein [Gossypium klotzschianum]
ISGSSQSLLTSTEAWTRSLGVKGDSDNWSCNSMTKGCWGSGERTKWRLDGGFEMMIGLSDIFQVKARALFEGLKFAWAQGFCQVEIESDNALLIAVI